MAAPRYDEMVRISSDAAQNLIDTFYPALSAKRSAIASFYEPASTSANGSTLPYIVFNGNVYEQAREFQDLFEKTMPRTQYEVSSFDCHIVNPSYVHPDGSSRQPASSRNFSMLVTVNGSLRVGEDVDAPKQIFNETFLLVPNQDNTGPKGRGSGRKDFLIQSDNFRIVA